MIFNILATLAAAIAVGTASPAAADSDDPSTPWQISQNPALPGNQPYQQHCADVPISCALHFSPGTGTWERN